MDGHGALNATDESPTLYNATLNLASRILELPSRVLARVRRLDNMLNQDIVSQPRLYSSTAVRRHGAQDTSTGPSMPPVPGPLGFITSGYFLGLFIIALVLNRIQNIVVPPRRQLGLHHLHNYRTRWSVRRMVSSSLFPVNLSSTFSRWSFRIPSIYLLTKSLLIWLVLLLQGAHLFPSWKWGWLQTINDWVACKPMEDICWFTFTSACIALAVGALTSGLEGINHQNSPFNLFSFAFQLYIYSSPSTHGHKVQGGPSRPDIHIMITMIIPLLQLTLLHCLEVKKEWARQRLLPTALCSVLTLTHFHAVIWVSPPSYPISNFVPCVVESLLCLIIFLSISLNAMTQMFLEGAITRPFIGHADTLMPKLDEDFSIALFRLGTASMEVTNIAGLGNEVGGVVGASAADIARRQADEDRGTIEVDRSGVVSISPAFERQGKRRMPKRGFANEISNVRARTKPADAWADAMVHAEWHRETRKFLLSVLKAGWTLCLVLWAFIRQKWRFANNPAQAHAATTTDQITSAQENTDEPEVAIYRQFLRGESVSDDDDEDFEPPLDALQLDSRQATPSSSTDDEDDTHGEALQLYSELSEGEAVSSAPLLLAHMTSPSPLTRRQYGRLMSGASQTAPDDKFDDWDEFARERRASGASAMDNSANNPPAEHIYNCVICTTEPREIICWPCRCLALCDDCRENLASRSSASKHTCPCCRRSVEGYSKIYIP
ncbi:hypothetical protein AcV7_008481 [Taiwanofungus camphoratus]|nr:hypothetical protein AcV7_008481 [Antrodia cinnamomea]